jgi:hypothetical protein
MTTGLVNVEQISLDEQIDWLAMFISDTVSISGICDEVRYLNAIKSTLEAEKKRRDTNILLNGGRR